MVSSPKVSVDGTDTGAGAGAGSGLTSSSTQPAAPQWAHKRSCSGLGSLQLGQSLDAIAPLGMDLPSATRVTLSRSAPQWVQNLAATGVFCLQAGHNLISGLTTTSASLVDA